MRRDKLLSRLRSAPGSTRLSDIAVVMLRYQEFVLFNQRGSHRTCHHLDGRVITIVVPHGRHKLVTRTTYANY